MHAKIIDQCIVFTVPFSNLEGLNVSKFKQNLLNIYLSSHCNDLILNLEKVNFIDAKGLESLLFAGSLIQEENGRISLCSVNPYVRQVLMQTRLYKYFDVNRSIEESLEFIKDSEYTEICKYQSLRLKLKSQIA